ncbi:MAG: sigma 54-interacting transcriptional regulator [Victivallales bacterium]|nr:sigma 54-interacting transcriptional regulator [Victivallales bacterium]
MLLSTEKVQLKAIHQISHSLLHQRDVSSLLGEVLDILQNEMKLKRATLTLKREECLVIEASKGLSKNEMKRGRYMIGEGITGKVAQTGKSKVIPDISSDPGFLDRTKARKSGRCAFICVPIAFKGEIIGTLSIDHPSAGKAHLYRMLGFLETIANILADAVATFREEQNEKLLLEQENLRLRRELGNRFKPGNIVGNCGAMQSVYGMIAQVADSTATVLIRGESGTGKELVAKAIHYASLRKDAPFVAVNCAALPENLIESELFGHEKGSFTGASSQRKGRFELANGGTLFLDEIGDVSLPVQVRLLRILQERKFERVGGTEPVSVNVRVIAATSRDLEKFIEGRKFREDLFYRLNVFPIHLPALRERKSDIVTLMDHFLEKYNKTHNRSIKRISTPAINMMTSYHWPGNVRELESCIERAVLMSTNNVISAYDLPPSLQTAQATGTVLGSDRSDADFTTMVRSFEREMIVQALKNSRGNVAAAARSLGTTKRIIHYKISNLNIKPEIYKS